MVTIGGNDLFSNWLFYRACYGCYN